MDPAREAATLSDAELWPLITDAPSPLVCKEGPSKFARLTGYISKGGGIYCEMFFPY